jgi:hypothetical protein
MMKSAVVSFAFVVAVTSFSELRIGRLLKKDLRSECLRPLV